MHKNRGWLIFLLIVGLPTLILSSLCLYKIYNYSRLDAKTQVKSIEWFTIKKEPLTILSLIGLGEERYILKAAFAFEAEGVFYKKETELDGFRFRNEWAAEQEMAAEKSKKQFVWFQSTNPRNATLQKVFPLKESLSSGALIGIFLYFICLGYRAHRY